MERIYLNNNQIHYLIEVIENPIIQEICENNAWYAQFIPSMRFDLIRKAYITEKQLYQIEKVAKIANIPWRFMY